MPRQKDCYDLKASLDYILNSRSEWNRWEDPISNNNNNDNNYNNSNNNNKAREMSQQLRALTALVEELS